MSELDPETLIRTPEVRGDELIRGQFGRYTEGYASMMVLRTAVKFGIFSIASEPVTVEGICASIGTDHDLTEMFLDTLVQMGLLERKDGRYSNSVASALYLDPESDYYQGNSLEGIFNGIDAWSDLENRLKNGPTYRPRDQVFGERWIKAIAESCLGSGVGAVIDAVDRHVDLSRYDTFFDLGGGHGLYTIGFVHKHPNLEGIVFDIPMMCPIAEANSKRYGVPIKAVPGDFYKEIPGQYDVVFSSFNLSTSDIRMADPVFGCVKDGGILILRRHLPVTSKNDLRNLEWSLSTWDGKGKKNYGGSWLPTAEQYMDRLVELGMRIIVREQFDQGSELVILEKPL